MPPDGAWFESGCSLLAVPRPNEASAARRGRLARVIRDYVPEDRMECTQRLAELQVIPRIERPAPLSLCLSLSFLFVGCVFGFGFIHGISIFAGDFQALMQQNVKQENFYSFQNDPSICSHTVSLCLSRTPP